MVFGAHTDLAVCGFGSHRSRCLWFLAHTDLTDLTEFFVGGFLAHTDPTDLTELH